MKRAFKLSLAVGLASVAHALPLVDLIESDVDVFASVRSFSETRAQWQEHPIAELYQDEGLRQFFEAFAGVEESEPDFEAVLQDEFGLSWDELFELFPGQGAFAVYNAAEMMLGQAEQPDAVLMAEFSGTAERLDELMQIQFKRNAAAQKKLNPAVEHELIEETFMGETLFLDETFDGETTYIEDGFALVDGIFLLATPAERLRRAVEAIKQGAEQPISGSEAYLSSREQSGRGDVGLYVNFSALMPPLNARLLEQVATGGLAQFGITAASLDSALALSAWQAGFLELDLVAAGIESYGGLLYSEKRGLLSLWTYADGILPAASYVPEGVLSASVSLFDLGAMLAQLEKVLTTASPNLPLIIDIQMQNMRTSTGVDLRTSILQNLGGNLVSLAVLKEGAQTDGDMAQSDQFFALEVKDAQALSKAIEALKDLAPGSREAIVAQEYQGYTIYTVKGQATPGMADGQTNDVSYVITRSHLIVNIGSVGLLQQILSRMDTASSGFWQLPETERLFEGIARPNAVTRSYLDLEQMLQPFLKSLLQAAHLRGMGRAVDAASIPDNLETPFRMIYELNEAPDGLFSRALILKTESAP